MTMRKITLFCVFGEMQCVLHGLKEKKTIFHTTYLIVAPLCSAFPNV